ncbi:hypothetical protein UY3_09279 [Chelonia mydas]|uniref:Uncharacterized protein n=1 Tax=Chelonia mydas TaxID=8469 RepID=M7BNH0_CHEMY|nr:hypothetical protein UY3_09279 [Chelonia mydas]
MDWSQEPGSDGASPFLLELCSSEPGSFKNPRNPEVLEQASRVHNSRTALLYGLPQARNQGFQTPGPSGFLGYLTPTACPPSPSWSQPSLAFTPLNIPTPPQFQFLGKTLYIALVRLKI